MKKTILKVALTVILGASSLMGFAQSVGINATGAAPAPSAMLDVSSTTKGFLLPRMTAAQMNAIIAPAVPLLIFNTTINCFEFWTGANWQIFACNCLAPPPAPGSITGPVSVCSGASGIVYSIAPVPGAVSYTWTVPPGATITSGQGTTSITVTFGPTSGNVCVTATNSCGTGPATCLAVAVVTPPLAPGPISGLLTICAGNAGYVYSVPAVPGCTYNWTVAPSVGTITSGQGTATITITAAPSAGTGLICVTATNACGTSPQTCIDVTVLAGSAPITLDHTSEAYVPTFNIVTTNPQEIIMIAGDGWPNIAFSGPVTVDGNPTTFLGSAFTGNSGVAAAFAYMCPLPGTHTVVVNETGYNDSTYLNFASSFAGGCQLSVSKLVVSINSSSLTSPLSTTVTTVTPNNMLWVTCETNTGIFNVYSQTYSGAISSVDLGFRKWDGIDAGVGHGPAAAVGPYTVTVTDPNTCCGQVIILVGIEP